MRAKPTVVGCFCDNIDVHYDRESAPYGQVVSRIYEKIPWEDNVECAAAADDHWEMFWPDFKRAKDCCIVAVAADFYLLEHIIFESGIHRVNQAIAAEFLEAGFGWNEQIQAGTRAVEAQAALEKEWGPVLRDYLHYACVAEMTHSWAFTETFTWQTWDTAFRAWGKVTKRFGRAQTAQWAIEIFSNVWTNTAFGGRRWKDIATVLLAAETGEIHGARFDYHLFLDRVFSLQHNTGCVFSKYTWNETKYEADRYVSVHLVSYLPSVLDAHHSGDIYELYRHASPQTQDIHDQLTGDKSYERYAKSRV